MNDIFVVPLTNSDHICLIDSEDAPRIMKYLWHRCSSGHIRVNIKKLRRRFLHQFLLLNECIDHENRLPFDNRKGNLRVGSFGVNQHNINKIKVIQGKPTTSKFKGVQMTPIGKWKAGIYRNRQYYYLGYFESEVDAALAYNTKAIELYGKDASLNEV